MVVSDVYRYSFSGFGDAWDDYCGKTYAGNQDLANKCRTKPMGILTLAPWTVVGKAQRGLPNVVSDTVNTITSITGSNPGDPGYIPPAVANTIFGMPKYVMYGGIGLLTLGIVGIALKKKGKKRR